MSKQVSMIAATAASVATAYVAAQEAGEHLSMTKFNAVVNMAASVAARLRVEHINTGSNLETNKKGELVALIDLSKAQRDAFIVAFTEAGIGEKDAANIASMGRTVARHFVPLMVATGSIRTAKSGDEMAEFLRESLLAATGEQATYNALEKARARGWKAPEEEEEEEDAEAPQAEAPQADVDLSATLESAPQAPEAPALTPSDVMDEEVQNALATLRAAVARDDWDRLNAAGFGGFLTEAKEAHKAFMEANAEAEKALSNA